MNLTNRSVILIIILILLVFLLPAITGLVGLIVDNELPDGDDYDVFASGSIIALARMTTGHQVLSGLMLGISVFALFGVYQGGRSNHRRFNDRTLDTINLLFGDIFSVTALLRAVFVFPFVELQTAPTNTRLNKNPNPIHSTRRYNHAFHC